MGFWAQLFVGCAVPLEKTRVRLEPPSGFGRMYSKIHEKIAFFGLFFNNVPKNHQRLPDGGGTRPYGTPIAQGLSLAKKNGVASRKEPKFSPRVDRPKAIAYGFELFSWAPRGCRGIFERASVRTFSWVPQHNRRRREFV